MLVARRPKGYPSQVRYVHVAAPIGGLNTISPGTDMPETDAVLSYNLIGSELGLRSRLAWREWCTGLNGEQVRTMIGYTGSSKDGSSNRLFACTTSGIWDCTASSPSPTRVVTFPTQNNDSGWGAAVAFVTPGGYFIAYADEANGYFTYTESTTTWAQVAMGTSPGQVSGANPATFVHVAAWKNRLWFTVRDSSTGVYLGLNAVYGVGAPFTFGGRFRAGGDLRGIWNWTGSLGVSMDDALVGVSGGGDVVIYQGTDPSSASTFGLQGVCELGAVPAGRRICSDFGGDILAMSATGIIPLSKLVLGTVIDDRTNYQTAKIANLWNQLQLATSRLRGWSISMHPADASIIVTVPITPNQPTQQLAMSLSTKGWSQYRDMPMGVHAATWNGSLYFGTEDGRVCVMDGYVDGVTLANPNVYSPVGWSLLTAFSNLGDPFLKQIQTITTRMLTQGGGATVNAEARFGFDIREAALPSIAPADPGAIWDSALWDQAFWAGQYQPMRNVFGAIGIAPEMAVAIRGTSTSRTVLVGIDVGFDKGGDL